MMRRTEPDTPVIPWPPKRGALEVKDQRFHSLAALLRYCAGGKPIRMVMPSRVTWVSDERVYLPAILSVPVLIAAMPVVMVLGVVSALLIVPLFLALILKQALEARRGGPACSLGGWVMLQADRIVVLEGVARNDADEYTAVSATALQTAHVMATRPDFRYWTQKQVGDQWIVTPYNTFDLRDPVVLSDPQHVELRRLEADWPGMVASGSVHERVVAHLRSR